MRKICAALLAGLLILGLAGCAKPRVSVRVQPWAEGQEEWMGYHLGTAWRCYEVSTKRMESYDGLALTLERWENGVKVEDVDRLVQPIKDIGFLNGTVSVSIRQLEDAEHSTQITMALANADTKGKTAAGSVSGIALVQLPETDGYWLDAPWEETQPAPMALGGYLCGADGTDWKNALENCEWALVFRLDPYQYESTILE